MEDLKKKFRTQLVRWKLPLGRVFDLLRVNLRVFQVFKGFDCASAVDLRSPLECPRLAELQNEPMAIMKQGVEQSLRRFLR